MATLNMKYTSRAVYTKNNYFLNSYADGAENEIETIREKLPQYFTDKILTQWRVQLGLTDMQEVKNFDCSLAMIFHSQAKNFVILRDKKNRGGPNDFGKGFRF